MDSWEPSGQTNLNGYGSIGVYRTDYGAMGSLYSSASYTCQDSLFEHKINVTLYTPAFTTTNPKIISSLSSVALVMSIKFGNSLQEASSLVCQNLVPCVPCTNSGANCTSGCADSCSSRGAVRSVYEFNAIEHVLLNSDFDPAYLAWPLAQSGVAKYVDLCSTMLMCMSEELCGSECASLCPGAVFTLSKTGVHLLILESLADVARTTALDMRDASNVTHAVDALLLRANASAYNSRSTTEAEIVQYASNVYIILWRFVGTSLPLARAVSREEKFADAEAKLSAACVDARALGVAAADAECDIRVGCVGDETKNMQVKC